jgi:hypothetical protein
MTKLYRRVPRVLATPEADQQIELVRRITLAVPKIWFWHTANERFLRQNGQVAYHVASFLRKMGVRRGVLDLIVESPAPRAPKGCRFEMKGPDGALTPEQIEWIGF